MQTGVLLMAHGTPSSLDDMPEYLRLVRGGRPPSAELVAEMRHNYQAIGGRSPLTEMTLAQAEALRARLGPDVPVAVGMRNWHPFIKDALAELAAAGVDRIIGIPLAPQFSTLSVQKYIDAAPRGAAGGHRSSSAVRSFRDASVAACRHSPSACSTRSRRPTRRSCSPPTVCRSASSRAATRTPTKWRRRRAGWRPEPVWPSTPSPTRVPAGHRSRGWGPTSAT